MTFKSYLYRLYKRQRGAVSPFLFGMLAGVAIFSAGVKTQARLETQRIYEEQDKRAQETAETYRRAVENALMSETAGSFGTITADRVNQYVSKSVGGGTRSGSDITLGAIDRDTTLDTQRVMITTSDDDFVRARVGTLAGGGNADNMATDSLTDRNDVVTVDTSNIRQEQIQASLSNMQKQAEVMYGFWAQNGRFPGAAEYTSISDDTGLTNFWGSPIDCVCLDNNSVTLTSVTPWGQTLTVGLNM